MKTTLTSIVLAGFLIVLLGSCGAGNSSKSDQTASPDASPSTLTEEQKAAETKQAAEAKKAEELKAAAEKAKTEEKSGPSEAEKAEAAAKAAEKAKADAARAAEEAAAAELARLKAIVVSLPVASPASGLYKGSVKVSLSCATPEARVVYTIDGSDPSPESGKEYTSAISLSASTIIKVLAYVPKGNPAPIQAFDYTFDEVCVNGGPDGDGTRSRPYSTIAKAVATAKSMGFNLIKLGPDPINESIELSEPFSYIGGWDRSFTKKSGKRSVIKGLAMEGSSKKNPGYGFKFSGTKADAGRYEALEVHGGESGYSAGVFLTDKSTPVFTNCSFVGGAGTYGYGALIMASAAPSFNSCELNGGAGASSYGLSVDSARVTLTSSVATAGNGTVTAAGAMITDGRINAVNSVMSGNVGNVGYGVALYNSKGSKIEASTLFGGSGRDATALFISVGDPVLLSCILASDGKKLSYGIHDNYGESAPSQLKNLIFMGCANALYNDMDSKTLFTAIAPNGAFTTEAGKSLAKPLAPASKVESPYLGESPYCRTPADSPESIVNGGLVASSGTVDAAGVRRTEPWSIGAYEIDR